MGILRKVGLEKVDMEMIGMHIPIILFGHCRFQVPQVVDMAHSNRCAALDHRNPYPSSPLLNMGGRRRAFGTQL